VLLVLRILSIAEMKLIVGKKLEVCRNGWKSFV